MKVSSYSPRIFDNLDHLTTGNIILICGAILVGIFIIFNVLIVPFLCIIFPNNQVNNTVFDTSSCGIFWFLDFNRNSRKKCNGLPSFPYFFILFVILLILSAFVIHYNVLN